MVNCKFLFQSTEREEHLTPLPRQGPCRFFWYRRLYPRRCRWFSEANAEETDEVCLRDSHDSTVIQLLSYLIVELSFDAYFLPGF